MRRESASGVRARGRGASKTKTKTQEKEREECRGECRVQNASAQQQPSAADSLAPEAGGVRRVAPMCALARAREWSAIWVSEQAAQPPSKVDARAARSRGRAQGAGAAGDTSRSRSPVPGRRSPVPPAGLASRGSCSRALSRGLIGDG